MTLIFNLIIRIVAGAMVAFIGNVVQDPESPIKKYMTLIIGVFLGGLGSVAADQLLNYGPTLFDSNFIPAFVGAIVLSFVGVYAGKKWLGLSK